MINLEQLYRQVIMDNYKNPKNKGLIISPDYTNIHLKNPSCGDDMHVCCKVEGNQILDVRHDGHGCSICCSSASVMSELLKGRSVNEANEIILPLRLAAIFTVIAPFALITQSRLTSI